MNDERITQGSPSLRDLVDEAIALRHKLYYGIKSDPDMSEAANRLGGVLAKLERQLMDRGLE